jgi:hypothetical protein
MAPYPVELRAVVYNPATQSFEGRAIVHDPTGQRSYACAVAAPITTDFSRAAEALEAQAMRFHLAAFASQPNLPSSYRLRSRVAARRGAKPGLSGPEKRAA